MERKSVQCDLILAVCRLGHQGEGCDVGLHPPTPVFPAASAGTSSTFVLLFPLPFCSLKDFIDFGKPRFLNHWYVFTFGFPLFYLQTWWQVSSTLWGPTSLEGLREDPLSWDTELALREGGMWGNVPSSCRNHLFQGSSLFLPGWAPAANLTVFLGGTETGVWKSWRAPGLSPPVCTWENTLLSSEYYLGILLIGPDVCLTLRPFANRKRCWAFLSIGSHVLGMGKHLWARSAAWAFCQ